MSDKNQDKLPPNVI